MEALAILAEPACRRIVEYLADGEASAGEIVEVMSNEFGLVQPATSRCLRRLREADLVQSRPDGRRRFYSLEHQTLQDVDAWLDQFRGLWGSALSALEAEVRRGKTAEGNGAV